MGSIFYEWELEKAYDYSIYYPDKQILPIHIYAHIMKRINAYITSFFVLLAIMTSSTYTQSTTKSAWYKCIRPSFTPPNYVFPVVWTILYLFLGYVLAETLAWSPKEKKEKENRNTFLTVMAANLVANASWSFIYFRWKYIKAAFGVSLFLLATAAWMTYHVPPSPNAQWCQWMLMAYTAWLAFATLLTFVSLTKESACRG